MEAAEAAATVVVEVVEAAATEVVEAAEAATVVVAAEVVDMVVVAEAVTAADTRIVVLVRTTAKSSKSSADFLQGTARINPGRFPCKGGISGNLVEIPKQQEKLETDFSRFQNP